MANFEFLKGNIEVIILNSLYHKDRYGYEIIKEIKEKTESAYEIKQPTLYSYLKRLEANGLIVSYWGEESSGGRRRYYQLTEEGKIQCESFLSEWKYQKNVIDSLVSDEVNIEKITQSEATPLLGSKIKRQKREAKGVSLKEQQNLSSLLEQLTADKQKNELTLEKDAQDRHKPEEISKELLHIDDENGANNCVASDIIHEKEYDYGQSKSAENEKRGFFSFLRSDKKNKKERAAAQIIKKDAAFEAGKAYNASISETQDLTQENELNEMPYSKSNAEQVAQALDGGNQKDELNPKRNKEDFLEEFNKKAQQIIERNKSEHPLDNQQLAAHKNEEEAESEKNYKYVLGSALEKQLASVESLNNVPRKEAKIVNEPQGGEPATLEGLIDNYSLQGIKVRLYNKATSSYVPQAMLYKNKINLIASWLTYITFAFAALLIWLLFKDLLSAAYAISFVVTPLLFPLIFTALFFINPAKKIAPKFDFRYHLINTIIAFALITLLAFTLFMLFGGIFSDKEAVLAYIVFPVIAAVSIPLYVLYYKLFFKKALI